MRNKPVVIRNGKEMSVQEVDTQKDLFSVKTLSKLAKLKYGEACMLGGESERLTVHHIIPLKTFVDEKDKKVRAEKAYGLNFLDNVALLSKTKHRMFNTLEGFFKMLSDDVNAFLYLYRGKCENVEILDRVCNLMLLAEYQSELYGELNSLKGAFYIKRSKKEPFDIPDRTGYVIDVLKEYNEPLYREVSRFLKLNRNCCLDTLIKLKRLIELCEDERKTLNKARNMQRNCIEELELAKRHLKKRAINIYNARCRIK